VIQWSFGAAQNDLWTFEPIPSNTIIPIAGNYGGQCVAYAKARLNPSSNIHGDAGTWYNSPYCTKTALKSQVVACWTIGTQGDGHVGVVECYNSSTGKIVYSDSNYYFDQKIHVHTDINEDQLKKLPGTSKYTFLGYVTLK